MRVSAPKPPPDPIMAASAGSRKVTADVKASRNRNLDGGRVADVNVCA